MVSGECEMIQVEKEKTLKEIAQMITKAFNNKRFKKKSRLRKYIKIIED